MPTELDKTEARQGVTGNVRLILIVSIALAVVALAGIALFSF
jgi:hypothetical protein